MDCFLYRNNGLQCKTYKPYLNISGKNEGWFFNYPTNPNNMTMLKTEKGMMGFFKLFHCSVHFTNIIGIIVSSFLKVNIKHT